MGQALIGSLIINQWFNNLIILPLFLMDYEAIPIPV